ncbi:bifunctional pyr operon transcriptional regulator/uracil phosphoribosyltransferase PyrR [Candidatus Kryptobacter tengchongensis]|uniref:Bifunctional protein PyrR n=1 Tax=Kryptobacter tengchongensis TaxID=1643429 RepID=A0A916PEZ0_KRYT1|nr:bifunctional pyr operon transcriptional regulator/uracil phosphoribosyltransferase PyrR [Candidatus Kryptobacter tengchongensis]CUS85272.1 pyrimidine operon attenuation protein / uracil phosphoribosyltransferase [Candidatus Kryptobacter tengchongensis]CUT04021.1 pyrimidine operon attenuation protein / uracil phosphoribosyltransferase [Candidatus Kryptobacter tengchongensis]
MKVKEKIMDADDIERTLNRLVYEIVERNKGSKNLAVVGIRTRGEFLAKRIAEKISKLENNQIPVGILDITFYRDDIRLKLRQPEVKTTEINFSIDDRDIILVDDVLFTGRTVRAALDELMDFGRPKTVQLVVLIDRGNRELPIQADFVGRRVKTSLNEEIRVKLREVDGEDSVILIERD